MRHRIDLSQANVRPALSLSGYEQGISAREKFQLDELDRSSERVIVQGYDELEDISPTFFQGLFSESYHKLGETKFIQHYDFSELPDYLKLDIDLGIRRLRMSPV